MPNENNRKGKWQPFDSLAGFRSCIQTVASNRLKKPKPELAEDECDELDFLIQQAIQEKGPVIIQYYNNTVLEEITGVITKIDGITRTICINHQKIDATRIVRMKKANDNGME